LKVSTETNAAPDAREGTVRERELISKIRGGQTELYYELVKPFERQVYLVAFSLLRNENNAEDAAQEAILKALRNLDQFRGESSFGSWLVRITINEARMLVRRTRRETPLVDNPDDDDHPYEPKEFGDWREIPSEVLERKEARDILRRAIDNLPDKFREIVILRDIRQLNIAQTAELLGVTEGVVKTRLLRARLRLRDAIAPLLRSPEIHSRNWFKKGVKLWR